MNKVFYTSLNKKNFFCIGLTFLGGILSVLDQVVIPVFLLVLIVVLFDGPLNRDIFVFRDKKLFLLTGNENMLARKIALGIIFLGFVFCLSGLYKVSLFIFYGLLLLIFLFNVSITNKNMMFLKDREEFVDKEIPEYQTFEVLSILDNKSSLTFKLRDKFTRQSYEMEYKLNHGFIDYKELEKLLKSFKYDDSPVVEVIN